MEVITSFEGMILTKSIKTISKDTISEVGHFLRCHELELHELA